MALAHEGQQGIVKIKELIRSKVWFPKMNDKAATAVRQCFAYQCTYNGNPHLEPMHMSGMSWRKDLGERTLEKGPWRKDLGES